MAEPALSRRKRSARLREKQKRAIYKNPFVHLSDSDSETLRSDSSDGEEEEEDETIDVSEEDDESNRRFDIVLSESSSGSEEDQPRAARRPAASQKTSTKKGKSFQKQKTAPQRAVPIRITLTDEEAPYTTPYKRKRHADVVAEMNSVILFQELAIAEIGTLLRLMDHSQTSALEPTIPVRERIHKRILSGPSGVGKTETVRVVQHLLGMSQGEPNARQFIHIDGSVYKDITQLNRLIGAGPGYAACELRNSLVDDLLRAITHPDDLAPRDTRRDEQTGRRLPRRPPKPFAPPYIFLFIDEIDKTHRDFMSVLNGLLEEGQIKSSRGDSFVLPARTQMLVLSTSNYGHERIARMTVQDKQLAMRHVEADMHEKGLAPNSIERFGSHIIFFPISQQDMYAVIRKKVAEMLQRRNPLRPKYGNINYESAMECIADFVVEMSDPQRGIRNTLKHLNDCLTPLLVDAFYKLEEMPAEQLDDLFDRLDNNGRQTLRLFKERLTLAMFEPDYFTTAPPSPPPPLIPDELMQQQQQQQQVMKATSGVQEDCDAQFHVSCRDIVRSLQNDVTNQKTLEVFRAEFGQSGCDSAQQSIHAFGISRGKRIINCMIVPLIVRHYSITQYDSTQTRDTIEELKRGYRELKDDYCTLVQAVSDTVRGNDGDGGAGLARLLTIVKERKSDFLSFDDDEDDEEEDTTTEVSRLITDNRSTSTPSPPLRRRLSLHDRHKRRCDTRETRRADGSDEECRHRHKKRRVEEAPPLSRPPPPNHSTSSSASLGEEEGQRSGLFETLTASSSPPVTSDEECETDECGMELLPSGEQLRCCADCLVEKPLAKFRRKSGGYRRKDGTRGEARVSFGEYCTACVSRQSRDKKRGECTETV